MKDNNQFYFHIHLKLYKGFALHPHSRWKYWKGNNNRQKINKFNQKELQLWRVALYWITAQYSFSTQLWTPAKKYCIWAVNPNLCPHLQVTHESGTIPRTKPSYFKWWVKGFSFDSQQAVLPSASGLIPNVASKFKTLNHCSTVNSNCSAEGKWWRWERSGGGGVKITAVFHYLEYTVRQIAPAGSWSSLSFEHRKIVSLLVRRTVSRSRFHPNWRGAVRLGQQQALEGEGV